MNGEQQKERATAVAKLIKQVEKMDTDFRDLWSAELESRQKEDEHLKELFASMLDAETQFRQRAFQQAVMESRAMVQASETAYMQFIKLVWWKRWGWCVFGYIFLIWTSGPVVRRAYYEKMLAERQPAPAPVTPDPTKMSEDQLRKYRGMQNQRPQ